jgi:hypothetical protein
MSTDVIAQPAIASQTDPEPLSIDPVGEQLKALASVARKLRGPVCLHELRSANGAARFYDAMTA